VPPTKRAGRGVERDSLAIGQDVERSADHQQAAAEHDRLIELNFADFPEAAGILLGDLVQVDVALGGVVFVHRRPLVGRVRRRAKNGEGCEEKGGGRPNADRSGDPGQAKFAVWRHGHSSRGRTRSGLDIGIERASQAGIGDIAAAFPDASTDICRMKVVFEAMIRRLGLSSKSERRDAASRAA